MAVSAIRTGGARTHGHTRHASYQACAKLAGLSGKYDLNSHCC